LAVFQRLAQQLAARAEEGSQRLWHGLRVILIDGTSCSMPDTPELANAFGYPGRQKPGVGFPTAHLMHIFDFATGMIRETLASSRYTNDLSGLPPMLEKLRPGDLLVGDRAFGCYTALALCKQRGVEGLFRVNQRVLTDFRPGRRHSRHRQLGRGLPKSRWIRKLGPCDQVVAYPRPRHPSAVVDRHTFYELPEEMELREIKFTVWRKGFRPQTIVLVTTLLDPEQYPREDIVDLYMQRWRVEIYIRDLKQTLSLDILKGKSVDVVMKELTLHTICYNLVRLVMLESARQTEREADRVSFADARDWLADNATPEWLFELAENPHRPGRFEPRNVKRRPKPFKLLERPRQEVKAKIERKAQRQRKVG